MGMKIFRPVRLALPASVFVSMKSDAEQRPSPRVMAVGPEMLPSRVEVCSHVSTRPGIRASDSLWALAFFGGCQRR